MMDDDEEDVALVLRALGARAVLLKVTRRRGRGCAGAGDGAEAGAGDGEGDAGGVAAAGAVVRCSRDRVMSGTPAMPSR